MESRSCVSDNALGTGLDTYKDQEGTIPPPDWQDERKGRPTVWNYYSKMAEHYDDDLIKDTNNTVEVLLIFAGLFSAVVTAFISQTYPMLKPDPGDTLSAILRELQHPGSSQEVQAFTAPIYAIRVNCFLFAGLFISIIVALLSILVKQWARSYQRDLAGVSSPHLRARIRHFRYNGAKRWRFGDIVGLLSIFMHSALLISGVGIIDLLLSTTPTVGYVALVIFLAGMTFVLITSVIPILALDAPFRSPLSKLLAGFNSHVLRCQPRLRERKGDEEEGIEDEMSQIPGNESEKNSIIRTQFHLDLDILSHLLTNADKYTERWLLDMCFEKLPQLSLLEKRDPQLILRRRIILEMYIFLAKGCIQTNKSGQREVVPLRLHRARNLCGFLSWFLSLRRTPDVQDFLCQLMKANRFDPMELPFILAHDERNAASITQAYSALGRVDHLLHKGGSPEGPGCSACSVKYVDLTYTLRSEEATEAQKREVITRFLIQRTDCLLYWGKSGKAPWGENIDDKTMKRMREEATSIQEGFKEWAPKGNNKKIWDRVLRDRESVASEWMKHAWFYPLTDELRNPLTNGGYYLNWKSTSGAVVSSTADRALGVILDSPQIHLRHQGISFEGNYNVPTTPLNLPPDHEFFLPTSHSSRASRAKALLRQVKK